MYPGIWRWWHRVVYPRVEGKSTRRPPAARGDAPSARRRPCLPSARPWSQTGSAQTKEQWSVKAICVQEKQVTHTNTRQDQHHTTHDKNNTVKRPHEERLLSVVVPFLALALCSCERFAGVRGVFSVGVSCVRVTCWLFYMKNHPPHSTTIEGSAATVRTTFHTRVGGRAKVRVGGRVEVRRALGRARVKAICKKRNRSQTQTHNTNNTRHDTTRTTPHQRRLVVGRNRAH